jgi:hypothetical protein
VVGVALGVGEVVGVVGVDAVGGVEVATVPDTPGDVAVGSGLTVVEADAGVVVAGGGDVAVPGEVAVVDAVVVAKVSVDADAVTGVDTVASDSELLHPAAASKLASRAL